MISVILELTEKFPYTVRAAPLITLPHMLEGSNCSRSLNTSLALLSLSAQRKRGFGDSDIHGECQVGGFFLVSCPEKFLFCFVFSFTFYKVDTSLDMGWAAYLWSRNLFGVIIRNSELCNGRETTELVDNGVRDETTAVVVTSMISFPGPGFVSLILRCFYC